MKTSFDTPPQVHHEFSPSRLKQFALCPASYRMQKGLADQTSEYAELGKRKHEAVNNEVEFDQLPLTDQEHVEYCRLFLKTAKIEQGAPEKEYWERQVTLYSDIGEIITSGYVDLLLIYPEHAIIFDWKFGYVPVDEAVENHQLAAYAAAVMQEYGIKNVECHIVQPAAPPYRRVTSYTYTDLKAIRSNIVDIIQSAKAGPWRFEPCLAACKYCRAKTFCPALREECRDIKVAWTKTLADLGQDGRINDHELAGFFGEAKLLKDVANEIEALAKHRAKELALNDENLPGYQLKKRAGRRYVSPDDIDAVAVKVSGLISVDEFPKFLSVSLTDLEKYYVTLAKEKFRIPAKKAREDFAEILADQIKRKPDTVCLEAVDD